MVVCTLFVYASQGRIVILSEAKDLVLCASSLGHRFFAALRMTIPYLGGYCKLWVQRI
jgi:hypothetical protein